MSMRFDVGFKSLGMLLAGVCLVVMASAFGAGGTKENNVPETAGRHQQTRPDLSPASYERVQEVTEFTQDFSKAESFEVMQGGAGTVNKHVNTDIFSHPAANLSFEERQQFLVGN